MKKNMPRIHVELSAYWGNDDADSTIKVSRRRWKKIQGGAEYSHSTWAYYEGQRLLAYWDFKDGKFSISCDGDRECIVASPVEELIVQVIH